MVVEIVVSDCRNGDVELHRIDADAENALRYAAVKYGPRPFCTNWLLVLRMISDDFEMRGSMQILAVDQRQELRMLDVIVPCELDEPRDGDLRVKLIEMQFLFS